MNRFDHFVKEVLQVRHYVRYTDDFVFLHNEPGELASLLPPLRTYLREQLALELHPRKISLRKLRQGIDFLGYVVLPHHQVMRTKTKRRMLRRLGEAASEERVQSYLGLLKHCDGHNLAKWVRQFWRAGSLSRLK